MDNGVILSGEAYPIDEVTNNSRIYIHVDLDMYLDLLIEKRKAEYEEFYFTNCIFGNFNELKKNVLKEDSYIIISKGYLCGRNGIEDFVVGVFTKLNASSLTYNVSAISAPSVLNAASGDLLSCEMSVSILTSWS